MVGVESTISNLLSVTRSIQTGSSLEAPFLFVMNTRTLYLVAGILAILAGIVQLAVAFFDKYRTHNREFLIGVLFLGIGIAVLLRRRTLT